MSYIELSIFTPEGRKFFSDKVDLVQIHGEQYFLGILPNHTPLITDVAISKLIIRVDGKDSFAAVGSGIASIDNNVVKLVVDSFEFSQDIDVDRARRAKERAEQRLTDLEHSEMIDVNRAKRALSRALNRLRVLGEE